MRINDKGAKKRVLIITWVGYDNYGSLLQAYCLEEVIRDILSEEKDSQKKIKKDVVLLNYLYPGKNQTNSSFSLLKKISNRTVRKNLSSMKVKILHKVFSKKMNMRKQKFDEFRRTKLNLYPKATLSSIEALKNMNKFDVYVTGSDQIWNPKLMSEAYLLRWVPEGATKISYAPSVCVNRLTETELKKYQTLESFKALSVREYTGAVSQISSLIHKDIVEVADPVILAGRDKLLRTCKEIDAGDFATIYLLNGTNKRHKRYAKFLKQNKLDAKIIPTTNPNNLVYELVLNEKVGWNVGPDEFVNLIYNSKILITDSFHGVILALLMHKDFIVYPRDETRSEQDNRLLNLLKKLNLENRFVSEIIEGKTLDRIDWEIVDAKLEEMRDSSRKYLLDAMEIAI